MSSLDVTAITHVAKKLRAEHFHGRSDSRTESDSYYWDAATEKINSMTNLELIELIGDIKDQE